MSRVSKKSKEVCKICGKEATNLATQGLLGNQVPCCYEHYLELVRIRRMTRLYAK